MDRESEVSNYKTSKTYPSDKKVNQIYLCATQGGGIDKWNE